MGQFVEEPKDSELRPAISICVLSQAMFAQPPALHLDFRLREATTDRTLTDDLQIHLLQLNHLQVSAETVYDATPVERWAYFLQNAEQLTPEEIRQVFPDQEFSEAAGVLEMISRTPEQLMAYNARLKFQGDEAARMQFARQEARQEGRQEGKQEGVEIGRIKLLQEFLGQRVWTDQEFDACEAAQLTAMADQLHQQFRAQNS